MNTLKYLIDKFHIDPNADIFEIPNVGRNDVATLLHQMEFKEGVEVGSASGKYLEVLCASNPHMRFTAVDPWIPYKEYTDYMRQITFNGLEKDFNKRMRYFSNYSVMKMFSMEAVKKFKDNSLDFVYIDANHDEPFVSQDIIEWSKKVRPGGIVAGHDYVSKKPHGIPKNWMVKVAIEKYCKENNIKPLIIFGAKDLVEGEIRDPARSWMFIKP